MVVAAPKDADAAATASAAAEFEAELLATELATARAHAEQAALAPDFDGAMAVGLARFAEQQFEEALEAWATCLALQPGHPIASYNSACCHAKVCCRASPWAALSFVCPANGEASTLSYRRRCTARGGRPTAGGPQRGGGRLPQGSAGGRERLAARHRRRPGLWCASCCDRIFRTATPLETRRQHAD